jgi:hypothetical protein
MNASPRGGPAGMREPPRANRRPVPLGRRPWFQAAMAVAALGLVAASVTMLVWRNGPPSRHVASNCGLINCGASLPGPSISTQSHISKAHRPASHAPAAPPPVPTPSPSPSQAPAPQTDVTLTFTSGSDRHDFDHFRDQLTLVNNGGRPVSGWTVQLTLPGDEIFSVETQPWWDGVPFEHWRVSGDTLTISADNDTEMLAPPRAAECEHPRPGQDDLPHRLHIQRRRLPIVQRAARPATAAATAILAAGPAIIAAAGPAILAAGLAITAAAGPAILAAGLAITAAVGPAILAAEP